MSKLTMYKPYQLRFRVVRSENWLPDHDEWKTFQTLLDALQYIDNVLVHPVLQHGLPEIYVLFACVPSTETAESVLTGINSGLLAHGWKVVGWMS